MSGMDGLAGQLAPQPQQALPPQGGPSAGGSGALPSIEEIVALLMQGIPPEELIRMGVPEEMLMQAIALLEQEMAAQQQSVPPEAQGGLAAQAVGI